MADHRHRDHRDNRYSADDTRDDRYSDDSSSSDDMDPRPLPRRDAHHKEDRHVDSWITGHNEHSHTRTTKHSPSVPRNKRSNGAGISVNYTPECFQTRMRLRWCLAVMTTYLIVTIIIIATILINYLPTTSSDDDEGGVHSQQRFEYRNAAIATDSAACSEVGKDVLLDGGSAVDAAIAALLCIGTINPNNIGIGGGHFMLHYDAATSETSMYDAREVAPLAATRDMFVNDTQGSKRGGLAIAVPGEVKGYYEAHKAHGILDWERLFQPSISLARDGFVVTDDLGSAIKSSEDIIREEPSLSQLFLKENGQLVAEGDLLRRPQYAETLQSLAENGGDYFYDEMAEDIANDIQDAGGIITVEDLESYSVTEREPLRITLRNGIRLFTPPPPSSGAIVSLILNILDGYFGYPDNQVSAHFTSLDQLGLTYHRIVEAFKFGFGQRGGLADSSFVDIDDLVDRLVSRSTADSIRELIKDDEVNDNQVYGTVLDTLDDQGTSHISVVDSSGNAVSVTSTLNFGFGSKVRGTRTGIIFNAEMDDFSVPGGPPNDFGFLPSDVNEIAPGKRPLSSMTPSIFFDTKNDVYMVIGSSGGSRIITSIIQTFSFIHWGGFNLEYAIDRPRLNQQWIPPDVYYDIDFEPEILDILEAKGQVLADDGGQNIYSVVQVVKRSPNGRLQAYSDKRRGKYIGPAGY